MTTNQTSALAEPTTHNEIEGFLKAKLEAGEAKTGLYDTGLWFVVVDRVDDEVTFQWFESAMSLDDVIHG